MTRGAEMRSMLSRLVTAALGLFAACGQLAADEPLSPPSPPPPAGANDGAKYFETHVRPIFQTHCVSCHSGEKPKGGFSLTNRDTFLQGGTNGATISADKPADSLLLKLVSHQGEVKMPPKGKLS